MAQPLQSIAIQAPGFFGLNTQDSPTSLSEQFALVADNCVIDQFGRIGARKGWKYLTTGSTNVNLDRMFEYTKNDGTFEVISAGANKLYKGTTTLTEITPAGATITANNWSATNLNGKLYLFQLGHKPLVYDGTTCDEIEDDADYSGTVPQANVALSAYGRLWVANTATNNHTVYWSDLLTGVKWDTGSSGSIDVSKVWPNGTDEVVGLASHNGLLFIFGKRQILIYQGAEDPATMSLADTIVGLGCIARDSIAKTGNDLVFLTDQGVRSLNRTIQEKSAPMRDISKNIRTEFTAFVQSETGNIFSAYSPEEAFYILHLPEQNTTFCFDVRTPLEDGAFRVTEWNGIDPRCALRTSDGKFLIGKEDGVAQYDGYQDNNQSYIMRYFTNYLDFGAASQLKLLKNLKVSIIGGSGTQATLNWGYDYAYSYKKRTFTLQEQELAEYGIAEYGLGEFNAGVLVNRPSVNASGGGQVVQLGIESTIDGSPVSIQRITAQALIGRVL
jgi:hypothetical protein